MHRNVNFNYQFAVYNNLICPITNQMCDTKPKQKKKPAQLKVFFWLVTIMNFFRGDFSTTDHDFCSVYSTISVKTRQNIFPPLFRHRMYGKVIVLVHLDELCVARWFRRTYNFCKFRRQNQPRQTLHEGFLINIQCVLYL